MGKRIWKRVDICVCITDSLCFTPETNTTLQIDYNPIKKKTKSTFWTSGFCYSMSSQPRPIIRKNEGYHLKAFLIFIKAKRHSLSSFIKQHLTYKRAIPWELSQWRIRVQCRRSSLNSWVGKISWRRERLPTPVFWPGELHGLCKPWGCKETWGFWF